jgi:carbonic anhydrase/acetyltransferase-like protein (isoleucine patch superfamily)
VAGANLLSDEAEAMRLLLLLGSSIHAAEMIEIVARANAVQPTWDLRGLLPPPGEDPVDVINGAPVLKGGWQDYPGAVFLPSFGWPKELLPPRERLVSLIDPSAFVSRTATLGAGCVIYPNCFLGLNARLGDLVFCLSGVVINHDDVIEDGVTLASGAMLAGNVHIETDCYLGQGCMVRQHVRIGRGSTIGMGAVVLKDVPPGSVMAGNPARLLPKKGNP